LPAPQIGRATGQRVIEVGGSVGVDAFQHGARLVLILADGCLPDEINHWGDGLDAWQLDQTVEVVRFEFAAGGLVDADDHPVETATAAATKRTAQAENGDFVERSKPA